MRRLALCLFCGTAALAVPSAASAAGEWGTVETVSRFPAPPSAAIDDRGYAVLVWSRGAEIGRRVYGARRTPTRGFGEPFSIDTAGRARVYRAVTFDNQRNAIVAYQPVVQGRQRTDTRTVRANGARTDPATVTDAANPKMEFAAVAPGTYASRPVLGQSFANRFADTARARDGLLGDATREELDEGQGNGVFDLHFALAADDTVLAAFTDGPLLVSERRSGEAFGAVQRVSTSRASDARLAVGSDGSVVVVWTESGEAGGRVALASVRPPGGQFGPPVQVSTPGEVAADVDVVVTSEGVVRVAYLAAREDSGGNGPARLATLGGTTETLTAPGLDAAEVEVAADGRGGTTVAWQHAEADFRGVGDAISARAIMPSGRVGKRWKLTRTGEDGRDFTLAVGADGSALVAWTSGVADTLYGDRFRAVRRSSTGR